MLCRIHRFPDAVPGSTCPPEYRSSHTTKQALSLLFWSQAKTQEPGLKKENNSDFFIIIFNFLRFLQPQPHPTAPEVLRCMAAMLSTHCPSQAIAHFCSAWAGCGVPTRYRASPCSGCSCSTEPSAQGTSTGPQQPPLQDIPGSPTAGLKDREQDQDQGQEHTDPMAEL